MFGNKGEGLLQACISSTLTVEREQESLTESSNNQTKLNNKIKIE